MAKKTLIGRDALRLATEVIGGRSQLAELLGLQSPRSVWPYFGLDERRLPAEYCLLIEDATRKAGKPILCEQLRPDLKWSVLRESV